MDIALHRYCTQPKIYVSASQLAWKSGPTSGRQRYDVATSYRCRPDAGPTFLAGWVIFHIYELSSPLLSYTSLMNKPTTELTDERTNQKQYVFFISARTWIFVWKPVLLIWLLSKSHHSFSNVCLRYSARYTMLSLSNVQKRALLAGRCSHQNVCPWSLVLLGDLRSIQRWLTKTDVRSH